MADAGPGVRLGSPYPQQLGERESRQRRVTRQLDEPRRADALGELVALRLRTLVAPDQGRPDDGARSVEQGGAVHLATQADGDDVGCLQAGLLERAGHRLPTGAPPVVGILFRPACVR